MERRAMTADLADSSMLQALDAARTTRIVLIESHVWFRDCLAHALIRFLPDVSVEGADSVEEVVPGPAALLLIGIHPQFPSAQLRDAIDTLRRVGDGSPVGAYLHADNWALARLTARLGVAGIVMPNAGVEIVIASVRVMAAGGNFLPPEVADLPQATEPDPAEAALEEPLAQAVAQESRAAESLTNRELEVLQLLGAGRTNKDIAADLSISQSTVKVHLRRMLKKLGATNRTEAALQLTRLTQPQIGAD
jgi:two-component system nitrate/nitrite response regulator NarL